MVGAVTREGIGLQVMWQANMAHLGVQQAVHQLIVAEAATADSSTNGQVEKGVQALRCPPTPLAKRRGINVRIEADGQPQGLLDSPDEVNLRPARLGCR